jgi:spermidine/putrescine transport system ATP-binding protein
MKHLSKQEIDKKVIKALQIVDLVELENRDISTLSGGQQQRVAIARAIVNEPEILLLDEPLGALDLKMRKEMQLELKEMHKKLGITFIYVTHDQEEALTMSDLIVVMKDGQIQQIGTPTDIYNEPANAFVADFIGESNILDGVMREDFTVEFHGIKFQCVDKGFKHNEPVDVVIRPEDIDVVAPEKGMLQGTVTSVTFKGVHYEIIVDIDNFKWMIQTTEKSEVGDVIGISIDPDEMHIMKKSEYSGLYGDYSSFSDEFDELSTVGEEE